MTKDAEKQNNVNKGEEEKDAKKKINSDNKEMDRGITEEF